MQIKKCHLICCILALTLAACTNSTDSRRNYGYHLAAEKGWAGTITQADLFPLLIFMPQSHNADIVYVYIEGDGFAWIDGNTPSFNPTPKDPVSLELALKHGAGAAYIARPCQYTQSTICNDNKWWTGSRFSEEVIRETNLAVDEVKKSYNADKIVLVGYSGGGAVAALVAARRTDVSELVTVAGNLDIDAWVKLKDLEPLSGSLNPADYSAKLENIPQRHFAGADDSAVPPAIAQSYLAHFPAAKRPQITVFPDYDHSCCWAENWPQILKKQ